MWRLIFPLLMTVLTGCGGIHYATADNQDRRTPLEKAVQAGDVPEVKRLLAAGADPNDRGKVFGSPLNAAASHKDDGQMIRLLLAAGANPNGRAPEGPACWVSPLFQTTSGDDLAATRALLDAGASLQQSCHTQLIVSWLSAPMTDLLISRGLSLQALDENGRNQLHLAFAPPVVVPWERVEYLLRAGVPLNTRDRFGKTPLAYWREPRDYESHWFATWFFEQLEEGADSTRARTDRAKISALLERSGARL